MRRLTRFGLAAFAGAAIALQCTLLIEHAMFADGWYIETAFRTLRLWAYGVTGASGALLALALNWVFDRSTLSTWVRPAGMGALAGVAAVVIGTRNVASLWGGETSKGQAPILHAGLVYGVPVGLLAGVCGGLLWMKGKNRRTGRRIGGTGNAPPIVSRESMPLGEQHVRWITVATNPFLLHPPECVN